MKAIFETEDPKEIKRLAKSTDMAIFIFDLVHNMPKRFRDSTHDHGPVFQAIDTLLKDCNIIIDDIID